MLQLPKLYAITDCGLSNCTQEEIVEQLLAGGARLIQLRDKDASARELLDAARACLPATRAAGGCGRAARGFARGAAGVGDASLLGQQQGHARLEGVHARAPADPEVASPSVGEELQAVVDPALPRRQDAPVHLELAAPEAVLGSGVGQQRQLLELVHRVPLEQRGERGQGEPAHGRPADRIGDLVVELAEESAGLVDGQGSVQRVVVEPEREADHELLGTEGVLGRGHAIEQLEGLVERPHRIADAPGVLDDLVRAGVNVVRLNFSHGDAAHHAKGLFGAGPDERVHHALSRVQAMLGHRAVVTPVVGGGRWLAERQVLVPWGDRAITAKDRARPWPGSLPDPLPATVYPEPRLVEVTDIAGASVTVGERDALSAPPAILEAGGRRVRIREWAGPWPISERGWDPLRRRHAHRFQVVDADGGAWLLVVEDGEWRAEGRYD